MTGSELANAALPNGPVCPSYCYRLCGAAGRSGSAISPELAKPFFQEDLAERDSGSKTLFNELKDWPSSTARHFHDRKTLHFCRQAVRAFADWWPPFSGYHLYCPSRRPALSRVFTPPSLTLIGDGRLIEWNLRKEVITDEELKFQLREQNVEYLAEIKFATLEGDGRLSVLKRK